MWIRSLADADAACGAKAVGLARLIAAGQPVPEGFVIESHAFDAIAAFDAPDAGTDVALLGHALAQAEHRIAQAEIPADVHREVCMRAAALGRLAVRSSASIEDGEHGAGAGVFASLTDIAPADVWGAVRSVWSSALTPLAVAYARRRAAAIAIAVIVQRFVPGARMTIYTRPIGAPHGDELWLQSEHELERLPRSAAGDRPEAALALAAEAAIDASHGADVELVLPRTLHGAPRWIVQARPIMHPVRRTRSAPPPIVLAPLRDGRRWTWDIAHNPDPLSPAQAGLVEHIDRTAWSPHALRVCGGYLYTAPRAPVAVAPPADRAELAARIAAIEARFVLGEPASVAEAVERYVAFMQIWTCELSPLIAAARGVLLDRLAHEGHPPERIPALAASLIGPRRVQRDRVMAPAWDVAVPTFAETGDRHEVASRAPSESPPPGDLAADVELARAAADAAEHDDIWFARAQWLVRRALLARNAELHLREDDIFWLPLDEVITLRTLDPDEAHRRASAARAAHARTAEWDMPRIVHGEAAFEQPTTLRGVGVGPRVIGRVVRLASLASAAPVGRGDVVVTRAITPALAMIVEGCAALVSETGGLLDHGAALARELGITCVVGCAGAWTQLADGMLISVDGDAGTVGLA
jgi:pyruvate,water dikinase